MSRERLDSRTRFPSGMEEYLSNNGWHFNKRMFKFAISNMRKDNNTKIVPYEKNEIDDLLTKYNIVLKNNNGYDAAYVANMCKADYLSSSVLDEFHLVKFIKDYLDDPDGYDGVAFTRFYADCIGKGVIIPWEDCI